MNTPSNFAVFIMIFITVLAVVFVLVNQRELHKRKIREERKAVEDHNRVRALANRRIPTLTKRKEYVERAISTLTSDSANGAPNPDKVQSSFSFVKDMDITLHNDDVDQMTYKSKNPVINSLRAERSKALSIIEDYRVNKNPPLAQDLLDSLKKMERAVNQDIADNHAYASLPVAVYVGPII